MKITVTKNRIKEIIAEEIDRHNQSSGSSALNEAGRELVRALGLLESAAQMLDNMGDSRMDSVVNNVLAMRESLYTQLQLLRNVDYEREESEESEYGEY